MSDLERKFLSDEISSSSNSIGMIKGYGAVFGNKDRGGDVIAPGAFAKSLKSGRKIRMLWQHDPDKPIGTWHSAKEDRNGLAVEGRILTDTTNGRDAYKLFKNGAADGLSIGYRPKNTRRGSSGERIITEAELFEISLVTFPMNERATVTQVKKSSHSKADIERILKNGGVPGRAAKKLVEGGWAALQAKDPEFEDEIAAAFQKVAENLRLSSDP